MATEQRMIEANTLREEISSLRVTVTGLRAGKGVLNDAMNQYRESVLRIIDEQPTVDAVPVDEIRVDIMSLSLENQEAILNVSICGKPNEVKIPFSKEVAEVVHAEWLEIRYDPMWKYMKATCSRCGVRGEVRFKGNTCGFAVPDSPHCPHCGAAMKGVTP